MNRELTFKDCAWTDYLYWQSKDKSALKKINALLKDILRSPFDGEGKPEPLKYNKQGYWSRRIDGANRLVYKITDTQVIIVACKGHYDDK